MDKDILKVKITEANKAYRAGHPIMDDLAFDSLVESAINFSDYKTQIKYIGIFIKSSSAQSFELQALIDFTNSSKYKVE